MYESLGRSKPSAFVQFGQILFFSALEEKRVSAHLRVVLVLSELQPDQRAQTSFARTLEQAAERQLEIFRVLC